MSYGRTPNRGHGRRKPAHVWVEDHSFLDRRDRYYNNDIYDFDDTYYLNEHSRSPWYLEATEDYDRLIVLLISLALYAAGWLLKWLFIQLLRAARRRRGQAEAFEETCRQHLRRRRTECVRGEPSPEQLLTAWEESRTSLAGKLRLGALLSEIEPHVDQSLIRDEEGHIVGRRPGILGWLRWNCPGLVPHYKAIMAYKALADKVQMATGLQSKYSIVDVIDVFIEFGCGGAAAGGEARGGKGGGSAAAGAGAGAVAGGASAGGARTDWARADGPLGDRPLPGKGHSDSGHALENELRRPRQKLREVLRALSRRTLKALDDEVCYQLGLMKTRRTG